MSRYDFYADMYAAHSEIGYLLWLLLMLLLCDGALALALALWPQADVYLVPGISGYAQVPVIWGDRLPQTIQAQARSVALVQVDLDRLQQPARSRRAGEAAVGQAVAGSPSSTVSALTTPVSAAETGGRDALPGDRP